MGMVKFSGGVDGGVDGGGEREREREDEDERGDEREGGVLSRERRRCVV